MIQCSQEVLSLLLPGDFGVIMTSPTSIDRLKINTRSDTTLTQQLTQQFTWLIASGQLRPGTCCHPSGSWPGVFRFSINTVRSAYQKLEANGLVETRTWGRHAGADARCPSPGNHRGR